jgi:uncharacterized protein
MHKRAVMVPQPAAIAPLDVNRLEEGLNHLEIVVEADALTFDWPQVEFGPELELTLDVARMGDDLQIDCSFTGSIRGTCDRCLEDFERPVDGQFRALGRRGDKTTHELGDQDGIVFYDGPTLDLGGELREALLLQLPIQLLCADDCKGLCDRCGADLNRESCRCPGHPSDPRWAALARAQSEERNA